MAKPFIKWVGGKRALLRQMREHYPQHYHRYFEPFVGGGAVFFDLAPANAVLRDRNHELIGAYVCVRDHVQELIAALGEHDQAHGLDLTAAVASAATARGSSHQIYPYYYRVRALDPTSLDAVTAAARFIYLNHTCFNGLYRVNRQGKFNVPAGSYRQPLILDETNLLACSQALKNVDIAVGDFASIECQAGDFAYFDPPYDPLPTDKPNQSFTGYTASGFDASEQRRLRDFALSLHARGVYVALANHDTPRVRALYGQEAFHIHPILAGRSINSDGRGRGKITEVLITNVEALRRA
jgi:DNA adenine methylase